jgi:hypothetical protein
VQEASPLQHCASHWEADVPPSVQLWKQEMAISQTVSARQLSVWRQQLSTMHMLQGVPPGLRVQVPPSTGNPHSPLSQVSPVQHCWAVLQFDPMGRHDCVPHTPFWQTPEQHSPATVQAEPSMAQVVREQSPLTHSPWQHSLFAVQAAPSGEQPPKPQTPLSQTPLQQSLAAPQAFPPSVHWQAPCTQSLEQHSAPVVHASPWPWHGPQAPPALQTAEQQVDGSEQGEPSAAQSTQVPLLEVVKLQDMEQQSVSAVHRSPRGRQVPAWQTPARQLPLQQG